ncbi:RNA-binding protein [Fictibacillus sp. KIGAM418]|uniref:RNA-binding protein n=1 Tax=Fictibacillus marinisediminis TaxID=2878389 RepID=A0A9X2BHR8_9BACL|nr:RNA-binding protein [Fictibacillus marinisediminis]MCK6259557.1 RNA-binding protein [Fictibacillus marinisediminis]
MATWTSADLERLAEIKRNGEITSGIIRSVGKLQMPVEENGQMVSKRVEVAVFELGGGVKGYCPVQEFSKYEHRSLIGFVGTRQEVTIKQLHLDHQVAIVSVKEADHQRKSVLWHKIKELKEQGTLNDQQFTAKITGYNEEKQYIYVKVEGATAFMFRNDWNHERTYNVADVAQRNLEIPIKISRFDEETGKIQVSRKAAIEDNFRALMEQYENMERFVGRVQNVHAIHGIFIQLDKGVVVKGEKPSSIPSPRPNDIVSCRLKGVDYKKRTARVVITGYPEGQKERVDPGAFLYQ